MSDNLPARVRLGQGSAPKRRGGIQCTLFPLFPCRRLGLPLGIMSRRQNHTSTLEQLAHAQARMSTGGSASHDVRPVVGSHNSSTVRLAGSTSNASGAGTGAGHQHNAARSSDVSNVDRSASRMTVNQGRIYTGSASSGHGPSTSSANGNGQQHYRTDSDAATNPAAPVSISVEHSSVRG